MARRKFFRDEENPYDVVGQPAPIVQQPVGHLRDVVVRQTAQAETSGDIIRNLDEAARRMNVSSSGSVLLSPSSYQAIAGQKLFFGDAVFIGNGTQSSVAVSIANSGNVSFGDVVGTTKLAESFIPFDTTVSVGVSVYLRRINTPGDDVTIGIQGDASGSPDGSYLGSASIASTSISTSMTKYNFVFSATLSPLMTYYVVFERSGAVDGVNYYQVGITTNAYPFGRAFTFDGSAWTNSTLPTSDIAMIVWGQPTISGLLYRSTATTTGMFESFIGFSKENSNLGENTPVDVGGFTNAVSGVSVGSQYYLSDNLGAIGTSAGTNTRKVGIGIDGTHISITNIW